MTSSKSVPGVVAQFLDRASVAIGATRDASLIPRIHWVSGWQLDADQRSLWCFVPREFSAGLEASVAAKDLFSVTIEHIGPHECYQFKGRLLSSRPAGDPERAVVARCRERFRAAVQSLLPQAAGQGDLLKRYILEPALAVRLAVREIFLQTPGPGAGSLLASLEDRP